MRHLSPLRRTIGVVLVVVGVAWVLLATGIVGGSVINGSVISGILGAIAAVAGAVILYAKRPPKG
jgi:drug/metabolite transporter (DMT)-like permease